jgi:hypothetical protein
MCLHLSHLHSIGLHVPNVPIRKNCEMVGNYKHEFRVNTHRFKISQGIKE